MKTILVMGLLALSSTTFATVVKSIDAKNSCNLYRIVNEQSKDPTINKPQSNEVIVNTKHLYGFSLEQMDIDFDAREVKVQVVMDIILGVNKPLLKEKSVIDERNKNISMLINQVNRKVLSLEKICITNDNKIIYGLVAVPETTK